MLRKSLALAALITSFGASAQGESHSTLFLNPLGGNHSIAYAINDEGVVAGRANLANNINTQGFVWSNGSAIGVGTLGGPHSRLYGLNNESVAAGWSFGSGAVKWENGTLYDLDSATSGWQFTEANDINENGTIVGQASNGLAFPSTQTQAVIQRAGVTTFLAPSSGFNAAAMAVNDHDVAVGWSSGGGLGVVGSIWQNGTASTLASLGFGTTQAHDITNAGLIVGESMTASGFSAAVVWEGGQIRQLQGLQGGNSFAYAANEFGMIVGSSVAPTLGGRAVLWDNDAVIDLNLWLTAADREAGWVLSSAWDINESGWIVGEAYNGKTGITSAFVMSAVSAVPEPRSALTLLAGLAMISFVVVRKTRG